ncbi:hypothetical protein EAE99_004738 [Botrytis elliptica]|nr:hypothetical protein EAE99_004738 [Botrytis elliptica]
MKCDVKLKIRDNQREYYKTVQTFSSYETHQNNHRICAKSKSKIQYTQFISFNTIKRAPSPGSGTNLVLIPTFKIALHNQHISFNHVSSDQSALPSIRELQVSHYCEAQDSG